MEEQIKEVMEELQKDLLNPELIIDNKLPFTFASVSYRIRMPNQREMAEANEIKNKKYIELLQQPNTLSEKKLIIALKAKDEVDIEAIDKELKKLEQDILDLLLNLNRKKDNEVETIKKMEEEYDSFKLKRMMLVTERAEWLSSSIESQAQNEYYKYLTSACTEVCTLDENNQDKWSRVWKNYEEFQNDSSNFAYIALGKLAQLIN